ncbi:MAG: phage protease, partial [Gammaproteobacteria bacterium]|nr:phage protease [Gammaproteobacteria bacterium]MBU2685582.1 phage protease [Gammaproteobacteria bacterium]
MLSPEFVLDRIEKRRCRMDAGWNSIALAEGQKTLTSVPMFPIGDFQTDKYGKVSLTDELADTVIANFESGVLKTEVQLDTGHTEDVAHGWVRRLWKGVFKHPKTGEDVPAVLGDVELTEPGEDAIGKKLYQYISAKIAPYTDEESGKTYTVLRSVALTNQPVMRLMPALALSDSEAETVEVSWDALFEDRGDGLVKRIIAGVGALLKGEKDHAVALSAKQTDDKEIKDEAEEGGTDVTLEDTVTYGDKELKLSDVPEVVELAEKARKHDEDVAAKAKEARDKALETLKSKGVTQPGIELAEKMLDG